MENSDKADNDAENVDHAENSLKKSVVNEPKKVEVKAPSKEDALIVPFPRRLKKNKLDQQFGKFMEVFKKLHINIPFTDALEQMPSYVSDT